MRINNVSTETTAQAIVIFAVLSIAVTVAFAWFCIFANPDEITLSTLWNLYLKAFNSFKANSPDDPVAVWFTMVFLPLISYGGLIYTIIKRQISIKFFNQSLQLKSVDLLPQRINFNFNKPQYNFICGYDGVKNLKMTLKTATIQTKNGPRQALTEIRLDFTVLNNKIFTLYNTPINQMKTIYQIIDYSKRMGSFSYNFSGDGVIQEIEEKIQDYMTTGCKQILATPSENNFKTISILFFILGLIFLYSFKDDLNSIDFIGYIVAIPAVMFIGISFICDIVLLIDKWNEGRYRKF